jgi:hypothetical protein
MKPVWQSAVLFFLAVQVLAAGPVSGWRGNGTGMWPEATPPLEWHRTPLGILAELRATTDRPDDGTTGELVEKGLVRPWLVLGPLPVRDVVKNFGEPQYPGETTGHPTNGGKVGPDTWGPVTVKADDSWEFGAVQMPALDLAAAVGGYKPNQVAYAHTYLYSPRAGSLRAVVEHSYGLKVWFNGEVVYRSTERGMALGNYINLSRLEFGLTHPVSPRFDLKVRAGWNRLLLKVGTETTAGWQQQSVVLRLMEPPDVAYKTKNVLWMTELPHRSNATPIIAGDRVFVMAEPDELHCLDKHTGKVLWSAANNYYEALTPDERQANPAFKDKVDPLVAELKKEKDFARRVQLRQKIQQALTVIDKERFAWKGNDHFEAHFGIVGFTTPTPLSDGKHVWVWLGNGVAACYDLDGNRKWITRVPADELSYSSSPALADGVFAVFLHKLIGLDAATGKVLWEQRKVNSNNGAVLAARINAAEVFISQRGDIVRPRDGHVLYRSLTHAGGDVSWAPGVVRGDVIYLPNYGINRLHIVDFTGASGDAWRPKTAAIQMFEEPSRRNGKWVDRMTGGSPLVHEGLAYAVDVYGWFYAYDLAAKVPLYYRETELRGLFHYNSLPVAASATLIGKHIVIQDNQGTALVLEPGRTFKQVGKNRLATQIDRPWPVPGQEMVAFSPPVPDGNRLYIRGERHLYCIGAK